MNTHINKLILFLENFKNNSVTNIKYNIIPTNDNLTIKEIRDKGIGNEFIAIEADDIKEYIHKDNLIKVDKIYEISNLKYAIDYGFINQDNAVINIYININTTDYNMIEQIIKLIFGTAMLEYDIDNKKNIANRMEYIKIV